MNAQTMKTRFHILPSKATDLYIYRIPECDMVRLHKKDRLTLRKYARGFPFNDRERWEAEVVREPEFHINWSDAADSDRDAYDVDSVIPMQMVTVRVLNHRTL